MVGTNIVFENEKIKVWELFLKPGEKTQCHTHQLDYIFYVMEGSTLAVFNQNDQQIETLNLTAGETLAFYPKGEFLHSKDGITQIPVTHSTQNVGTTMYREILVETKAG